MGTNVNYHLLCDGMQLNSHNFALIANVLVYYPDFRNETTSGQVTPKKAPKKFHH